MSINNSCLDAVQRPQSGTTGNLMCKTQLMTILVIKTAFYGPDDPVAVCEVLFYFKYVWYLPRRDCPASRIWNHTELDVQNTSEGHSGNKNRVSWAGRPNGSGWSPILLHMCLISNSSWLSSCKTQLNTIIAIKTEFYGSDDLLAVVKVQFYFTYVLCQPRCDCPMAEIGTTENMMCKT